MADSILALRHMLHKYPELSGSETETARRIVEFFSIHKPSSILERLGGNGVAVVFAGCESGPTVLLRCELDALPIFERNELVYRSTNDGVSHKCGHDGHMAILAAVGADLAEKRLNRGRVVLLFQPAEENGQGAAAVIKDPRFAEIQPDFAFALHNLPGFPLGEVVVRPGTFNCASRGMAVRVNGSTAHAAQPETGRNPTETMCRFVQQLSNLPPGIVPKSETGFATIVGARLGGKAFGTAPGQAEVWATLRTETDSTMAALVDYAERVVVDSARELCLDVDIEYEDIFNATVNSQSAVSLVREAAGPNPVHVPDKPFRWSEDFGRITAISDGALFGIGAGKHVPALHNPDYDFPDELIPIASGMLLRLVRLCLGD